MMRRRSILGLAAALPLAGCGFRPLHGSSGVRTAVRHELAAIEVGEIRDRVGQLVRNRLLDMLTPAGMPPDPAYRLNVNLDERREGLGIERDDSVTRVNYTLTAEFFLRDLRDQRLVVRGMAQTIAAYNVIRSDYANLIAERDAVERAAHEVADKIASRVAVSLAAG